MKKLAVIFLVSVIAFTSIIFDADAAVRVKGYYRKDGTYVQPHYRSNPDGNPYNNWSFPGNVNPYTGKVAPGNPDTYLKNYYGGSSGSSYSPSYSLPNPSLPLIPETSPLISETSPVIPETLPSSLSPNLNKPKQKVSKKIKEWTDSNPQIGCFQSKLSSIEINECIYYRLNKDDFDWELIYPNVIHENEQLNQSTKVKQTEDLSLYCTFYQWEDKCRDFYCSWYPKAEKCKIKYNQTASVVQTANPSQSLSINELLKQLNALQQQLKELQKQLLMIQNR